MSHHLILDFTTRTILYDGYRSLSYSLCSFLHSLLALFLLGSFIFHFSYFPQHPILKLP
jgi:hypothetical protein